MKEIVFIYAGDPNNNLNCSPYTITRNVHQMLLSRFDKVHYFDWNETGPFPEISEDAIILGHPNYLENTATKYFFAKPFRVKILIHPLHTNRIEDNMPFDLLARKADHIFSICGPYWYDTLENTVFAHWKPKITRLDMAISCNLWHHQKQQFNEIGNRGIVYVGSSLPCKNLKLLTNIIRFMPDIKFEWYGGSSDHPIAKLPNTYVEGWQTFSDEKIKQICSKNDLFVNTSVSDANPTTILEFGLASGLIPVCTQTSGYWKDEAFINIPHDVNKAVKIIREWLNKPTEELIEKSRLNRKLCEEHYTWDSLNGIIWNKLQKYL